MQIIYKSWAFLIKTQSIISSMIKNTHVKDGTISQMSKLTDVENANNLLSYAAV